MGDHCLPLRCAGPTGRCPLHWKRGLLASGFGPNTDADAVPVTGPDPGWRSPFGVALDTRAARDPRRAHVRACAQGAHRWPYDRSGTLIPTRRHLEIRLWPSLPSPDFERRQSPPRGSWTTPRANPTSTRRERRFCGAAYAPRLISFLASKRRKSPAPGPIRDVPGVSCCLVALCAC